MIAIIVYIVVFRRTPVVSGCFWSKNGGWQSQGGREDPLSRDPCKDVLQGCALSVFSSQRSALFQLFELGYVSARQFKDVCTRTDLLSDLQSCSLAYASQPRGMAAIINCSLYLQTVWTSVSTQALLAGLTTGHRVLLSTACSSAWPSEHVLDFCFRIIVCLLFVANGIFSKYCECNVAPTELATSLCFIHSEISGNKWMCWGGLCLSGGRDLVNRRPASQPAHWPACPPRELLCRTPLGLNVSLRYPGGLS